MTRKDARIHLGTIVIGTQSTTKYVRGQDITPDSPVQLTVNSCLVLEGVTFTPGVRVNPTVTIAGAQKILGRVVLPTSDYGEPAFDVPYLQDIFNSIFIRSNLIDSSTLGRHTTGDNSQQSTFRPSFLRFLVRVQDEVTGVEAWHNISYLSVRNKETTPGGAGRVTSDVENPNPFAYAAVLSPSTRTMSGALLSSLSIGSEGNRDTMIQSVSDNQTQVNNIVMDGIATTFTLSHLPLSADATGKGANIVTLNGVSVAITSIDIATGEVVLTGAGSSDDEVQVDFETDYVASP